MKKILTLLLAMAVLFSVHAQVDIRRNSENSVSNVIKKDTLMLGTYKSIAIDTLTYVSRVSDDKTSRENMKSSAISKKIRTEELQPGIKKAVEQLEIIETQPVFSAEEQRQIELKQQLVAKESILQLSTPGILYVLDEQPVLKSATATSLGNTMQNPIVVGSFGSAFHYSNVQNTNNFTNDYVGKSSNDVFYKFTLTRSMIVSINHCGSPQWDTYIHLLDASGNRIDGNDDCSSGGCSYSMNAYLKKTLSAGTYYVVSEGYSLNGEIKTTIGGAIIEGDNLPVSIYAGSFSSAFQYTNSQNTSSFTNAYSGRSTNDVFYKFILSSPMIVEMSHCGSTLSDTYLHLLDESGNRIDYNDDYSGTGKCSSSHHSYLKKTLLAGVYYVVSEGYSSNGVIATKITGTVLPVGDILEYPVNVGTYSDYFQYSDTRNTAIYHADYNYNTGENRSNANDVFYKFTLSKKMIVTIKHCGSGLDDTFVYLLDASGNYIGHNDDYTGSDRCSKTLHAFLQKELNPGTYYVVSEGYYVGGSITTGITGFTNEFDYPATASGLNIDVVNGTATGSIPIELPKGVNGLQPNIGLVYSSSSGFGYAGYGWTLSGLSTISVTGKTRYHDNTVAPPASGNPLVLDGQRIITDGSNTVLENNRSVSVKASGSNYMVYYPDGSKATYTPYISGYLWRITRYETSTGNYITCTYSGNFISRIDYGGNGSGSHFASARFTYETNPDINTYYFGGQKLGYTQRIKKIETYSGSSVYRTYNLYYNSGYYKQLCRIETKSGTQSLAPVTITYGYNVQRQAFTSSETLPVYYYNNPNHGNALIYSGKFCYWQPGDQVIIMPRKSSYAATDKILLYELESDGFAYTYQMEVGANFKQLLTANLDNTPESEIIKINNIEIGVYTPSLYGGMSKIKTYTAGGSSVNSKYIAGDFEGTGKQCILSVTPNTTYMDIHRPIESTYILSYFNSTYSADDIIFAMDYNGDGKTDVVHISSSGLKIHNWSGSSWVQIAATTSITKSTFTAQKLGNDYYIRTILVGDINGDGMTDLLVTPLCRKSGTTYVMYSCDWKQYMSKGNGEFETINNTQLMTVDPVRGINIDGGAFLQDMNGDGRADLVTSDAGKNVIYYSDGNGFSNSNYHVIYRPDTQDGLLTSLGNLSSNNNRFLAFTYQNKVYWVTYDRDERKESFLTKAGYTQVDYNRVDMSGQNGKYFYSSGSSAIYPYRNVKYEPLYVVTNVKTSSGSTVLSDKDYTYTNAVVHLHGLGFCGFESTSIYDRLRGQTVTETYEPYNFGLPKKIESPVQTLENTWTVSTTSTYPKNSKITLTKQKVTDKLTGNIIESTLQYNIYGMPTNKTTTKGSMTETVSNTYESNISSTNWTILPKTETVVRTYNGTTVNTVTSVDYNSKYRPAKKTVKTGPNKDRTVSEESFVYDVFGNITEKSVKKYGSTDVLTNKYTYSTNGRFVLTATNEMGQITTYQYNDLLGLPTTSKDFKNNTTTYQYDGFGKLTKTTFPNGVVREEILTGTFSTYATTDPKLTITETGNPKQEILYDVFMREKSRGTINFSGTMIYSNTEYNSKGEIYRVSEPGNASRYVTYSYDSYGRKLAITASSGKTNSYSYNGRTSSVTENGITKTVTVSAEGFIEKITDPAGEIRYSYRPDGQPKNVTVPGCIITSFGYDDYGRQTSINDPSAGLVQFAYDNNGNVNKRIDAENRTIETIYNKFGMKMASTAKKGNTTELATAYFYNTDYMLSSVTAGGLTTSYTYDSQLRPKTKTENANGITLTETYSYSPSNGKLVGIAYSDLSGSQPPSTIVEYNTYGYQTNIKSGSVVIKAINLQNNFGQITKFTMGNGIVETHGYDVNGFLTQIKAAKESTVIQDFSYSIDPTKGLLNGRRDNTRSLTETFSYDNLNRLTGYTRPGQTAASVAYNSLGNITSKTDAGSFAYDVPNKPYAAGTQTNNPGSVPERMQDIAYTGFQRPSLISENDYAVTFTYGPDHKRYKMEVRNNSVLQYSRYYLGNSYEKEVPASGNTIERLYIDGTPYNAPAVYIRTGSGAWTLHYIHRDHLRSITAITNTAGTKIAEYSFDPWGRQRNPANQQAYAPDAAPSLLLGRGYTGHEHLPMFGLININARLYDPVLGRFLSPDPYVQTPDCSQSFNRYSYCLNNPLMYVDEDGEFILAFLTGFFKGLFTGGAPFKEGWESVVNEAKMIGGLFISDKTKNFWGQLWEIVSRFTWQLPQTALGFGMSYMANVATLVDDVDYYGGATVVTYYGNWGGVTLGSYINGGESLAADPNNPLFQHEYGHYLQSQASGLFYLQRYAIPSLLSKGEHNLHPVEQDANKRAFRYFIKREGETLKWNHSYNPIVGYNWDESYNSENNSKILNDTMGISWYDWCLLPSIVLPGLINTLWLNKDQ